jgi:hypothetical protein
MLGPGAELGRNQVLGPLALTRSEPSSATRTTRCTCGLSVFQWAMPTRSSRVPRSLSIWPTRSRVNALMSVISAASSGVTNMRPFSPSPGDAVALEVGDVSRQRRRAEGAPRMADHPGLDDDATVGGEQTAAAECGLARTPNGGSPDHLLPVVEPGSTPACLLARRTSLMRLSRRSRLAMRPNRILSSLSSLLTGVSGIAVWLVPKRALKNRAFCLRVTLATDRRPAES